MKHFVPLLLVFGLCFSGRGLADFRPIEPPRLLDPATVNGESRVLGLGDGSAVTFWFRPAGPVVFEPVSRSVNGLDLGPVRVLGQPVAQRIFDVAQGGDGQLFVWVDASGLRLLGRLLDASGQPTGEPFEVATTELIPTRVAVAGHEAGFTVAWSTDAEIRLRNFDLEGSPLTDDLQIASRFEEPRVGSGPGLCSVAASPERAVIIMGLYSRQDVTFSALVFIQEVHPDGTRGGSWVLDEEPGFPNYRPVIARRPGGFVAAWSRFAEGSESTIQFQLLGDRGHPIGRSQRANNPTDHRFVDQPRIDVSAGGAIAIAWRAREAGEGNGDTLLRAFDPEGLPVRPALQVLPGTSSEEGVDLAFTTRSELISTVVAEETFLGIPSGDPRGVYGRRFALICQPDTGAVCLLEGRFAVRIEVEDRPAPFFRSAVAAPVTADTGSFWFFSADNIETLVKVIDGRAVNGHFWIFFGSMSNVPYTVVVEDTKTGRIRRFTNPAGLLASRAETVAFPDDGSPPLVTGPDLGPADSGCAAASALCLSGGRFRATAVWHDPRSDRSGSGEGRLLAENSGAFWFFAPENLELIVKVLDGVASNGHYWVFVGSLTDVQVDITIEDTFTGRTWFHRKPPFVLQSFADIEALPES